MVMNLNLRKQGPRTTCFNVQNDNDHQSECKNIWQFASKVCHLLSQTVSLCGPLCGQFCSPWSLCGIFCSPLCGCLPCSNYANTYLDYPSFALVFLCDKGRPASSFHSRLPCSSPPRRLFFVSTLCAALCAALCVVSAPESETVAAPSWNTQNVAWRLLRVTLRALMSSWQIMSQSILYVECGAHWDTWIIARMRLYVTFVYESVSLRIIRVCQILDLIKANTIIKKTLRPMYQNYAFRFCAFGLLWPCAHYLVQRFWCSPCAGGGLSAQGTAQGRPCLQIAIWSGDHRSLR